MGIVGAILGDIAGSRWEFARKTVVDDWSSVDLFTSRCRFTDDTVLSIACKHAMTKGDMDFAKAYRTFGLKYPRAGYGPMFRQWLADPEMGPYGSFGNGSAMRVSWVGEAAKTLTEVPQLAKMSAECTHNDPEGIKGATAVADAVYMAKHGYSKDLIKGFIEGTHGYDLSRSLDTIRPTYRFYCDCQRSVPESIICFLESDDYDSCIRNALSLRGDTDTMAAIAGSIAESFYGTTYPDAHDILARYLDDFLMKELLE